MDKKLAALGTSMLVLKLLEGNDMYGYQIIRELEKQSQQVFQLQEGTLYPVLHGLEQKGALTSELRLSENNRSRKYYIITDEGKRLLQKKLEEWETYQIAVNQVIGGVLFE